MCETTANIAFKFLEHCLLVQMKAFNKKINPDLHAEQKSFVPNKCHSRFAIVNRMKSASPLLTLLCATVRARCAVLLLRHVCYYSTSLLLFTSSFY